MELEVLNSNMLYSFLKSVLPFYSFEIYMHILTNPYVRLLTGLPRTIISSSQIYLDGEKRRINEYAATRLKEAGYSVYFINKLHGKVILIGTRPEYVVIGTSNLSLRSFANLELVIVIRNPTREIVEKISKYFVEPAKSRAAPA